MGLSARDASDMHRLGRLAQNPQGTSREEIYLAVAALSRIQGNRFSENERALMHDILRRLTKDVGISVRTSLAERLADETVAPRELILLLAQDEIEVARPVILRSPLLDEADLLRLIAECSVGHLIAVAERPHISETIRDALSRSGHKPVLVALKRCAPAMTESKTPLPRTPPLDGAQKLIDKLSLSGQLKAGYLLRVLNQGQTDLFDLALAKLVNLPVIELRTRFYQGGPRAVALACRGVGIDRCVFPTVFNLSRRAHNMHASLSNADLAEVDQVFANVPKSSALSELSSLTFN